MPHSVFCAITPSEEQTPQNLECSRILGLLTRMSTSLFHLVDDFLDGDTQRDGKECWHVKHSHTLANDVLIYQLKIMDTLRLHLSHHPQYAKMLEAIFDSQRLCFPAYNILPHGQDTPHIFRNSGKDWTQLYTMDMWRIHSRLIPEAYIDPNYCLPLYLANYANPMLIETYGYIWRRWAELYYAFDGYQDVTGFTEDATRPRATDERSGNLALPIVYALKLSNPAQRQVLMDNYGCGQDDEALNRVLQIYQELNIGQVMRKHLFEDACSLFREIYKFTQRTNFPVIIYLDSIYRRLPQLVIQIISDTNMID